MRRLSIAAALLAALFVAPATASATASATPSASAGCGSTAAAWVDTFTGTETYTYNSGTYARDTVIEITEEPVVSVTDPHDNGNPYANWYPDESPDLVDGTPSWTVNFSEYFPYKGTYNEDRDYTITQVTCSGGQVTAFSGTFLKTMTWNGTSTQVESFAVSR
ncbi:hypothetical protein [Actinophytocola sediminis]